VEVRGIKSNFDSRKGLTIKTIIFKFKPITETTDPKSKSITEAIAINEDNI